MIFAFFPAIRQKKITANIFPTKIYSRVIILSLKFALHKNTVIRNRVCLITTCPFHTETQRYTTQYWFVWKYHVFLLHVLNKNENINNAGYWVISENRKN